MLSKILRAALAAAALVACALPIAAHAQTWAGGSDVSWVDQEESSGKKFYNSSGTQTDPFVLLKNLSINAIRLRVWVNPSGGWNNGADTLYMAKRAIAQGQRVMIDFHYSDSWADPGKQTIPAAWTDHSLAALQSKVYSHTYDILNYLKSNGVTVTWVQVGNEINSGLLWPTGSTSSFSNLAALTNQGYAATKAVFPSAQVIIHLANAYDDADFRWFFDNFKAAGGKWDITGMSHYPTTSNWSTLNAQAGTTMNDVASRYAKPVMIVEVGMDYSQAATAKSMVADIIARNKAVPSSRGLGVFYWEPEAYPGWQGYTLGALTSAGKFTAAMDPF
ncbi:glycoside hydrolase family 53 protein [Asticcacaulis solisilvae]|uniref:glycoside hydrolase family 53 protein n=1 Tax=Asticcacaulis solisilvae TaxID=1217274 RepID=UPI003FD791D8